MGFMFKVILFVGQSPIECFYGFVIKYRSKLSHCNMYKTHLSIMYQVKEIYCKVKMSKDTLQDKSTFKKRCQSTSKDKST